jgi:two-component system NtrC family sensor kinase
MCESRDFSLIFADVRMPDMDGLALFQEIEKRWPRLAARFVFVSGDVLHRDFGNIAEASGRPVIEKPFNFNLVRDTAKAVLAEGDPA